MLRKFTAGCFALRRRRTGTISFVFPICPGDGSRLRTDARLLLCSIVSLCTVACATPAGRVDALAKRHGAVRETILGSGFEHAAYTRGIAPSADDVRIYFEGDGLPFVQKDLVSADPTPRRPLALELMLADPGAAAYIA